MIFVNFLIIAFCLTAIISSKIHTDDAIKMVGISFIVIGAMIDLAHDLHIATTEGEDLLAIGVLLYSTNAVISAYFIRLRKRRETDQ